MRPKDVIFSIAHHQALRHILNVAQAAGMPQHCCFAVARAGQLRSRHVIKEASNAKMLQNTQGKGFRLGCGQRQNPSFAPQIGQHVRHAVIQRIFKYACNRIIFAVFLHGQISLGSIASKQFTERIL